MLPPRWCCPHAPHDAECRTNRCGAVCRVRLSAGLGLVVPGFWWKAKHGPVDERRNADVGRADKQAHKRKHSPEDIPCDNRSGLERPARHYEPHGAHPASEATRSAAFGYRPGAGEVAQTIVV